MHEIISQKAPWAFFLKPADRQTRSKPHAAQQRHVRQEVAKLQREKERKVVAFEGKAHVYRLLQNLLISKQEICNLTIDI